MYILECIRALLRRLVRREIVEESAPWVVWVNAEDPRMNHVCTPPTVDTSWLSEFNYPPEDVTPRNCRCTLEEVRKDE